MRKIAVIGAGSAGILSACHMISYLPTNWQITLIHTPAISPLGIGESTNPSFCSIIGTGLGFNFLNDLSQLDGTYKLGTIFSKWRKQDILNPLIGGTLAIHFDTYKFKDFALTRLKELWGDRFVEIQGTVSSVTNCSTHVNVVVDDNIHQFEFVIDCSGFPKDYSEYTISDLPLNHCLVHNIMEPGDWKYTGHKATNNGWMFEIPLDSRKSYGYLFNNLITSLEDAKQDFANELGVAVDKLDTIEYKFKPYYAKKIFDGRICKNGNAALFFEPMSANSLWAYYNINAVLVHYIVGLTNSVDKVNNLHYNNAQAIEEMIAYFYHGGSVYDTEFWKSAKSIANKKLQSSKYLGMMIQEFKVCKKQEVAPAAMSQGWIFTASQLLTIEKEFGYKYFT